MPETPITPLTPIPGNTTESPEPAPAEPPPAPPVPAVIPPAAPPARRFNRNEPPKPYKPRNMKEKHKEYLRGYGIKPEEWTKDQLASIYDFAPFFNMKIAVGFVTLTGIEAINDNRATMKWARDQLQKDETEAPREFKAEIAKLIPDCGRTIALLTKQLLENAGKIEDKSKVEAPLNKPPQICIQVNNGGGQSPANNGTVVETSEGE